MGVAVTFIAILELLRESMIEVAQADAYAPLHIRAASSVRLVSEDENSFDTEGIAWTDTEYEEPLESDDDTTTDSEEAGPADSEIN